jgi:hypothetical protein
MAAELMAAEGCCMVVVGWPLRADQASRKSRRPMLSLRQPSSGLKRNSATLCPVLNAAKNADAATKSPGKNLARAEGQDRFDSIYRRLPET